MSNAGKVAWVTGGSSGIGYAVAQTLRQQGCRVVISARGEEALRSSVEAINREAGASGQTCLEADYVKMDVMSSVDVAQAHQVITQRYGAVDILVNSAGFNVAARQWHEMKIDESERIVTGNLTGTIYTINAVLPDMRVKKSGLIVNIASIAGKVVTVGGGVAYTAAKHAVIALTTSINMAEFRNGIRACVVSPGETATGALARRTVPPTQAELDRMLSPQDVADAVGFVTQRPSRTAIYEIVISPTWNRGYL